MAFAIEFRKQNKGSNDAATPITTGAAVFTILLLNIIIIGTKTYKTRRLEEVHRAQKNFHPVAWDK